MEWTKEKPKEPGYYWLKAEMFKNDYDFNGVPFIVPVYKDGSFMIPGCDMQFTDCNGEWAGPIEPPA
jgi:hypothetical protein